MVETILQAAARVLHKESLAGFNTNRVAEVAGISVGSLYQYFPNKAALVVALLGHAHEELATSVEALVQSLPEQSAQRQARARLVKAVQKLIQQHGAELAPRLPRSTAQDCLVIIKALVEADAQSGKPLPRDLEKRIARVLYGSLTATLPR